MIMTSPNESQNDFIINISETFNKLMLNGEVNSSNIAGLRNISIDILTKLKRNYSRNAFEELIVFHDKALSHLYAACNEKNDDLSLSAFRCLIELLPHQTVLGKKKSFPDKHLAEILKIVIYSKRRISLYLPLIRELLMYPDVSRNIWKALLTACSKGEGKMSEEEIGNVLELINCTEKPNQSDIKVTGPQLYFSRTSDGVLDDKAINSCVKKLWSELIANDLSPKLLQSLLMTLLGNLMPRMIRPVFLTDFFMTTLEHGGSISILALQGIFTLYKDENMNYPDVYRKLYSMLSPDLFEAHYKARFYFLTDCFLSSTHLTENLVAGFVKKFARLCLVAPPADTVILLAFIVNLLIRHRGLKKLMHHPSASYDTDPFIEEESDPEKSCAVDSSLWEVELLHSHVLPTVSSAANFIHRPLPQVEIDLSPLLDNTVEMMFTKEHKVKINNPPLSFERPSSLLVPNIENCFCLWSLVK